MAAPFRKKVFITGASSGIGRAAAELLTAHGFEVWGTSRNPSRLPTNDHFHPVRMNIEDSYSIGQAWNQTLNEAGMIDIVVQNAGSGIFGAIEEVPMEEARRQWQILVEGPLRLFQLAASHFRPRRTGLIIGVSSLAAELPMPFSAHYSAGKSALTALLAGLAMELKPFGVRVVDLRPGDIRTGFNDDLPKAMPDDSSYLPWSRPTLQECERLMREAPGPELVAHKILDLARQGNPPAVTRVGTLFQATLGPLGVRVLPWGALLKSIRKYYGLHKVDQQHGG